jgi:uncharacterized protein YjbJ (UPF0337 family)
MSAGAIRAFVWLEFTFTEGMMDQDRIKGKVKDAAGRVQRQAGEWTDDEKMQGEGAKKQAEGKAQETWGKAKDLGRDIKKDAEREFGKNKKDRDAA